MLRPVSALGVGCGESLSFLSGPPPLHSLRTIQRPPNPQHAHTFPKACSAGGLAAGPPAPGKEQWNSSRPPRVPGLPSFPVINGGATIQLLLKMLHPRAPASFPRPSGGPDQDRWPLYLRQAHKAKRPGDQRRDQGWGADPRRAPAASLPPCVVFCAREELGVRKSRIFPRR